MRLVAHSPRRQMWDHRVPELGQPNGEVDGLIGPVARRARDRQARRLGSSAAS